MKLEEAVEAIMRGETSEQYRKRLARLRRLSNERDELEDTIQLLTGDPEYEAKLTKKRRRLEKVAAEIESLR